MVYCRAAIKTSISIPWGSTKKRSDLPASVGEYTDLSYIWKGAIIMGLIKAGIGAL